MRINYRTASPAYLRAVLTVRATTFETIVAQHRARVELARRGEQAAR